MFRRITAAASRLFTVDSADGSFYSLERLNARVRAMVPTHPALVLLWCQILLLVSHTDYRWWAEVQQTPRYARGGPGGQPALVCWDSGQCELWPRSREALHGLCCRSAFLLWTLRCRENVFSLKAFRVAAAFQVWLL